MIRELRLRHSWSQEKLAEIVGVNLRTIQRIETGDAASISTRAALATAFGIEPEQLDPTATNETVPPRSALPSWPLLGISAAMIALGWTVLALSVIRSTPLGTITPQAIGGLLVAVAGFAVLVRTMPLGRLRLYAVLGIAGIAMLASPPAWTIQSLTTISLWATFELGIVLSGLRTRMLNA